MQLLHTLRRSRALARWILLWWCMALGAAVAAPLMQAAQHTLVCSASGSITVQDSGAPDAPVSPHLDCVLCLAAGAPPRTLAPVPGASLAPCLLIGQAASLSPLPRTAAPPPGRGPPLV